MNGAPPAKEELRFLVPELKDKRHMVEQESSLSANMKAIVQNRTLLLIVLSSMVAAGGRGLGVVLTYLPLYLTNGLHLNPSIVGVLFTTLLAGSIVGPLLGGRVSDILGRMRTMLLMPARSFVFTLALVLSGAALAAVAGSLVLMGLFVYAQAEAQTGGGPLALPPVAIGQPSTPAASTGRPGTDAVKNAGVL